MIGLMLKLHVKPGEEQAVEEQMKVFASECMRTEPGTLLYTIVKDKDGSLGTMEIYESPEAIEAHAATPHHADNVRVLTPLVSRGDIDRFEVIHHPTRSE